MNTSSAQNSQPFLQNISTVEQFTKLQEERLQKAQQILNQLQIQSREYSDEQILRMYDDILLQLDAVASQSSLLENVHPDSAMRNSAEKLSQKAASFGAELSLNRTVYDLLSSLDVKKFDKETQFYVEKTLREFRLSGVDKDEATRKKIKQLLDEIVEIGQEFSRNIRSDVRTVVAENVNELDGLPQDFIQRHPVEKDGTIKLTINYPDAVPVFTYAKNENLRKRMYMEYNNRAYPQNKAVLEKLITKRHELAQLLGYDNYAAYVTANKMVKSEKNAADFIEKIAAASEKKSKEEYAILVKRKKQDVPTATKINLWENSYYSELVRKAEYDFDAQSVRPYFQYEKVKEGILSVTEKLFDVKFKKVQNAPVWHPSVECLEIFENNECIGRLYLDMHPRENKYNHAAQFGIRTGIKGKQLPEAALICNFPGGVEGDPGLMEHSDVTTFFHEFGHLLHSIFAGKKNWAGTSGIQTEWDFVETPSQLLEEWAWDAKVLATFAKHYQTGEPISEKLVQQMKRANEFGKALSVRQQMYYAKLSLSCYDRKPQMLNLDKLSKELREKYTPYSFVDGTHFYSSFGHLDGYSAIYYTYMWSLVIAKDLFTQFDKNNLLKTSTAQKYKEKILAPGGSKPAAELVKDFLGRDFNFDGWKKWLEE